MRLAPSNEIGNLALNHYRVLKQWQEEDFGKLKQHESAYFRRELSRVPLHRASRVLELGFGNGSFMTYAMGKGYLVHGTEADAASIDLARKRGFEAFTLEQCSTLEGYDLVVAFDVFEHLDTQELHVLFDALRYRLLKPGGHVLARFPNGQSPFGLVNQYGDITHKSVIGREKIFQLCYAHDMEVVEVRNPSLWLHHNPLIAAVRLLQSAAGKLIELGTSFAYYSRVEPMQINMVAHLRRPAVGKVAVGS